ncbi:uncharacterized protein LOC132697112 [Cylas formicarius]|uniref:uncharacterized protein LOC132697112 n=1 Tax=Cylas formicarius TaxID=197179 RepID=UPI002958D4A9|nr:uncharacterized protein LOC132697112 [Cylas formicarius]
MFPSQSSTYDIKCPIVVDGGICGENSSLHINKEFKRLYEEKMQRIDLEASGDCFQEKIKLQHEWIESLTQQNEMLVQVIQELEYQATERVRLLQEQLETSAQCLCENQKLLQDRERSIQEYQQKVNYFNSFGDVECIANELKSKVQECDSLKQMMHNMSGRNIQLPDKEDGKHSIYIKQDWKLDFENFDQMRAVHSLSTSSLKSSKSDREIRPSLRINQNTKRETGNNTLILINADKKVTCSTSSEAGHDNVYSGTHQTSHPKTLLPMCKSESELKPTKECSKDIDLGKYNSFIRELHRDSRGSAMVSKKVSVPNHIPVKIYVNNLECNKPYEH